MKTLIIFVLLIIAAGGAFLSKPGQQNFKDMIQKQMGDQKQDLVGLILHAGKSPADQYVDTCKFNDRFLWVTVERDGKTLYTGAFGTWFGSDLSIRKATN